MRSENAPQEMFTSATNGFYDVTLATDKWRTYTTSSEDGLVNVQIAIQSNMQQALANSVIQKLLIPGIISLPFFAFFIWQSVNKCLLPLQGVARELGRRKTNDLSMIDEVKVPTEVRTLTSSVNALYFR